MRPQATPPQRATLRLSLLGPLTEVRAAAAATRDFLIRHGWPGAEVTDCELALVEACNNALQHRHPRSSGPAVRIEIQCDARQAEIRIADSAPGFNWSSQPLLPPPEAESGRGLFLIHAVMDDVGYTRSLDGNLLVLRKRRKP